MTFTHYIIFMQIKHMFIWVFRTGLISKQKQKAAQKCIILITEVDR